ncbi:MAG: malto-oligosyltrehalose trehalohydrolase [Flavitalea sp.]
MIIDVSKRSIGVNFTAGKIADVRLWAPLAKKAILHIQSSGEKIELQKEDYGYWHTVTNKLIPGDEYKFSINKEKPHPDPASLLQVHGVHNASTAFDLKKYQWTDKDWNNPTLEKYIIYELHAGAFSPTHNFKGIEERLDYLIDLGINAIEIMPVAQFPGARNWGYDGVFPFAVQDSYGGAIELQSMVNACHQKGIAVILDVIYNHIGPEGNYLPEFGPYFTDKYSTPWGRALNFDDGWNNGTRDYFIENVLMWFRDFHIDALRMDAVHAIKDYSAKHIIKEIRENVDELISKTGHPHYLIGELDLNDPQYINPQEKGGYGLDAQWIDEFHHAARVTAGQAKEGYYADFEGITHLAKSYKDAYVYDGQFSHHRKKFFGVKTNNPGKQFIVFSQNHDQTGNRMLGERTSKLVSFEMQKLLAGAVVSSPYIPMFFMGEEWSEPNPFLFFISHTDKELAALTNAGRKKEFSYFNWAGEPPDPRLEATFDQSNLQWHLLEKEPHRVMHEYYKSLIGLRVRPTCLASPKVILVPVLSIVILVITVSPLRAVLLPDIIKLVNWLNAGECIKWVA